MGREKAPFPTDVIKTSGPADKAASEQMWRMVEKYCTMRYIMVLIHPAVKVFLPISIHQSGNHIKQRGDHAKKQAV